MNDQSKKSLIGRFVPGAAPWLLLSAFILIVDQWTKRIAIAELEYGRPNRINEYLDLTRLHNEGAAFSLLADAGGWQRLFFIVLGGTVSVLLSVWLARLPARGRMVLVIGLALIIGGALGNIVDRLAYGYVVDFLHFHYEQHYWPAFNVADVAITCGAGLVILDTLFYKESPADDS